MSVDYIEDADDVLKDKTSQIYTVGQVRADKPWGEY